MTVRIPENVPWTDAMRLKPKIAQAAMPPVPKRRYVDASGGKAYGEFDGTKPRGRCTGVDDKNRFLITNKMELLWCCDCGK